ncbi:MAG: hypothetical protein U9Q72_01450 [Patescibacteria group bacterium]|nr:hypothetical protein [Patescibacteria group bacterium]
MLKSIPNNSKLILFLVVLGFLAGFYLFKVETDNHNSQYHKEWTAVYFLNPTKNSLAFAIENYEGKETIYQYSITEINGKVITTAEIKLSPGQKKDINLETEQLGEKVIIRYNDEEIILKRP